MKINSLLSKPFARLLSNRLRRDSARAVECQHQIFGEIIRKAGQTAFGKEHQFSSIRSYTDFCAKVPITEYEGLKPYIDRISLGEKDVLWPGLPIYFAKTSGTTSGVKYIPITKESIHNHIDTARNALLMYIDVTGKSRFTDYRMIFLQGSPVLEKHGAIASGRLSGIAAHYVPAYLQKNRLPSWETNCLEDWETKVERVVEETISQRMSLISGIPSWLRMYFEKLTEKSGKTVGELFPDFQLLVYGGVNYEPYRPVFDKLIGRKVDTLELYPASEGFFAFQDRHPGDDLLLNVNSGIFYEFVPAARAGLPNPGRIPLEQVRTGIDYALVISSNAGLFAYSIGDTVCFTSLSPYRIRVSGRTSQFISAFGEHMIVSEAEGAMTEALSRCGGSIREFTVAPLVNPEKGIPRHEWLVEFDQKPLSPELFAVALNQALCDRNIYYSDLIKGHVLDILKITEVRRGTFNSYMKECGMLGGQNKVPRLADNRTIADSLIRLQRPVPET